MSETNESYMFKQSIGMLKQFNDVVGHGFKVRSHLKDGLQSWKDLKVHYSDETFQNAKWKVHQCVDYNTDIRTRIYNLSEFLADGEMNEPVHFIVQCVRIPHKNPVMSEVRLMQIAYNLGQLKAVVDVTPEMYPAGLIEEFYALGMDKLGYYTADPAFA